MWGNRDNIGDHYGVERGYCSFPLLYTKICTTMDYVVGGEGEGDCWVDVSASLLYMCVCTLYLRKNSTSTYMYMYLRVQQRAML